MSTDRVSQDGSSSLQLLEESVRRTCMAAGCGVDLSTQSKYCQQKRLCPVHQKANAVQRDNSDLLWRFCQQCGKLELLTEFDTNQRSCRRQLARRRAAAQRRSLDTSCLDNNIKHSTASHSEPLPKCDPVPISTAAFTTELPGLTAVSYLDNSHTPSPPAQAHNPTPCANPDVHQQLMLYQQQCASLQMQLQLLQSQVAAESMSQRMQQHTGCVPDTPATVDALESSRTAAPCCSIGVFSSSTPQLMHRHHIPCNHVTGHVPHMPPMLQQQTTAMPHDTPTWPLKAGLQSFPTSAMRYNNPQPTPPVPAAKPVLACAVSIGQSAPLAAVFNALAPDSQAQGHVTTAGINSTPLPAAAAGHAAQLPAAFMSSGGTPLMILGDSEDEGAGMQDMDVDLEWEGQTVQDILDMALVKATREARLQGCTTHPIYGHGLCTLGALAYPSPFFSPADG